MRRATLLFVLVTAGSVWPGTSRAQDAQTFVVAAFEQDAEQATVFSRGSLHERVPGESMVGTQSLRWEMTSDSGVLSFSNVPSDLREFRTLRMRVRAVKSPKDAIYVRFVSANGSSFTGFLPAFPEKWASVEVALPTLNAESGFEPDKVEWLQFFCHDAEGSVLELDDVQLVKRGAGWRYSREERAARGRDPEGHRYAIASFEEVSDLLDVRAFRSTLTRKSVGTKRKPRHAGRWSAEADERTIWLEFGGVPADIRAYRTLRFRARAPAGPAEEVHIRFSSGDGYLSAVLPELKKKKWRTVTIELPHMEDDEVDAAAVSSLRFVVFGSEGFVLELDDLEVLKGPGGWRMSDDEALAHAFGEKRVKKVKTIETDHFVIRTDSAAARKKFPRALEQTLAFVLRNLRIGEMQDAEQGKLPVYIFQSSELYFDFCVRKGWTRAAAAETGGHGSGVYFATYYQSPRAAVVAHELTHSIFHRAKGAGGGSWFQEGVAVFVEERWEKRSAAATFATRLRSGQFVKLREFFGLRRLVEVDDVRGGPMTADALYAQAGAFFEFLFTGPLGESRPEAVTDLAKLELRGEEAIPEIERILGASAEDLEAAWIAWGKDPPKPEGR